MNVSVSNSGGSSQLASALTVEEKMNYSNGAELARKRQVVFVGHDLVPRYAFFMQAGGVPDREDQSWSQHKPQGRNFTRSSSVVGRQGLISGNLEPYYELMTEICYNLCGKPFLVQKIAVDDYVLDNAGTRLMRQFRFPTTDAPKIWLWDVFVGTKDKSKHYKKTKIRQISMDGARNGDAGSLSGSVEMHSNEIVDGYVPMPFWMAINQVLELVVSGATGGTFTITVVNPATGVEATTAAITRNASATVVQTALEALTNVGPGDLVCTGGPLGTSPVVITGGATFQHLPMVPLEVNGSSLVGDDAAVTAVVTTVGSDGQGPKDVTGVPLEIDHVLVYMATDKADLDSIDMMDDDDPHILGDLLGHNFSLGDLWNPVFTENRSRFPSNFVGGGMNGELALVLPEGIESEVIRATEDGCVADRFFLRIAFRCRAGGAEFWIDAKVQRSAAFDPNDSNDIFQKSYPLVLADDDDENSLIFTTVEVI